MNAFPSRPMTPDEIGQAAEVYISRADLEREYAKVAARRGKQAATRRRWELAKTAAIIGQFAVIGCLGLAVARLADQYRVEVIHTYQRDDGTVTNSAAWSSLPDAVKVNSAINVLWQYVELWEGYSSGQAERAWNIVSALSTPEVRRDYQAYAGKDNPRAPRNVFGERDLVNVEFAGFTPVCTREPCNAETTDAYQFRFNRSERVAGVWSKPELRVATLRFRRLSDDARKRLPWWQVATFNNAGVVVWEYPGSKPEGVAARAAAQPGDPR